MLGAVSGEEQINGVADIRNLYYGATATKNLIAKYREDLPVFANYPIFENTYTNVNVKNIDGKWYIPAREELKALFAGYSGVVYESIQGWTVGPMPDYDSQACKNARSSFNAKLNSVLSNPLDPTTPYWSSTEISQNQSYSVYLNNGAYLIDNKALDANCRWIREF